MLKYIFLFMASVVLVPAFSQVEDDGKGTRYKQFSGCVDEEGAPQDSCLRMTDTLGKLTICITIDDLIDLIDDGGGMIGCEEVQECVDGDYLCDLMNAFGTSNYVAGDFALIRKANGDCKVTNLFDIPGFGDTCRVINNANGSYSHFNENNTEKIFGYLFECKNDSVLVLTDWDGTHVDSCTIKGSAGGGGGSDFDCDSVEACLEGGLLCELIINTFTDPLPQSGSFLIGYNGAECGRISLDSIKGFNCDSVENCLRDGLLCEILADLADGDTQEGDRYVTIQNGQCVLTDSVYIDICGILQEIQEESVLEQSDIAFILRDGECFKVPIQTSNSDCIAMDIDAGFFKAELIIDPDPTNVAECRENGLYVPSGDPFSCDSITANFDAGSYQSNDKILTLDGNTGACEYTTISIPTIDCPTIGNLFPGSTSAPTDSILVSSGGFCKKVKATEYSPCNQNLAHWDFGSCEQPKILVQCPGGCVYMTPCDIQDYFCGALHAPGSHSLRRGNYPTVENTGIRTFKSKKEAQKSSIPIGGLYLVEGTDEIKVKTRQL